jgi:hypothetical protein
MHKYPLTIEKAVELINKWGFVIGVSSPCNGDT